MPVRILIAEDSPHTAETLSGLLKGLGYEVRVAEDGARILTLFQKFKPDLLILDYMLPAGTGGDALQRIRCMQGGGGVPVIFLTGAPVADVERVVGQSPLIRILPKPLNRRELESTISEMLPPRG